MKAFVYFTHCIFHLQQNMFYNNLCSWIHKVYILFANVYINSIYTKFVKQNIYHIEFLNRITTKSTIFSSTILFELLPKHLTSRFLYSVYPSFVITFNKEQKKIPFAFNSKRLKAKQDKKPGKSLHSKHFLYLLYIL